MNELYSLISPRGYRAGDGDGVRSESLDLVKRLGADWFLHSKTCRMADHLTCNPEVIRYRRDALREVMEHSVLLEPVRGAAERLSEIDALTRGRDKADITFEEQFYSI